ncbi:MAG: hypothetical protein HC819_24285 [Cyclobacteriaceae bacterium]|nr:hypothetical protein [Cyclobacteriaceae bacterium]
MKNIVGSLFLCYAFSVSVGQKADSCKRSSNEQNPILPNYTLSLLADELTKSNPEKSIEMAREGLALANKIVFQKVPSKIISHWVLPFRDKRCLIRPLLIFIAQNP